MDPIKERLIEMGITNSGDDTERRFCDITGWTQDELKRNDHRGDARSGKFPIEKDFFVEIKKQTLNQVRPYKGIPIVSYDPESKSWLVLPPKDVLELCLGKRGQHVADPTTCINLGKASRKAFKKYRVPESQLAESIERAIEDFSMELKDFCDSLREQQESQREENQLKLREALRL